MNNERNTIYPNQAPQEKKGVSKSLIVWCSVAFLVILVLAGGCSSYNGMVSREVAVDKAWGDVQAAYQRRFDLIPNLVNTVKGYAAHESQTLENVTNARVGLVKTGDSLLAVRNNLTAFTPDGSGPNMQQMEQLERGMSVYVNAVHEAYPDLKASENFKSLQDELERTANRINTEHNVYNKAVEEYNTKIRTFPSNIFAGLFGFEKRNMFAASQEAQTNPTVNF